MVQKSPGMVRSVPTLEERLLRGFRKVLGQHEGSQHLSEGPRRVQKSPGTPTKCPNTGAKSPRRVQKSSGTVRRVPTLERRS